MKRCLWLLLLAGILCGCGVEETLETVSDEWIVPVMAQPRDVSVQLPEDALLPVLEQDGRKLYMGESYEIVLETVGSGDLNDTVQMLCGFGKDQLTVFETNLGDVNRYDFVWATTGEQGQRLGRAVILDDGAYHYCMSVLRDAGETKVVWKDVFGSFSVI